MALITWLLCPGYDELSRHVPFATSKNSYLSATVIEKTRKERAQAKFVAQQTQPRLGESSKKRRMLGIQQFNICIFANAFVSVRAFGGCS